MKSNLELLHLIIEGGADVNLQTTGAYEEGKDVELGNTALHYACARRDKDFIAYLVQHGADVTIKNGVGKTPLDMLTVSREEAKRFVDQVQPNNFSEIYRDEDAVVEEIRELLNSSPVDRNPLKVEAEDNTKQPEAIFSSDQRRLILDALAYSIKKVASNIFISDGFLKKNTLMILQKEIIEHLENNNDMEAIDVLRSFYTLAATPRGGIFNFFPAQYGETRTAIAFKDYIEKGDRNLFAMIIQENDIFTPPDLHA